MEKCNLELPLYFAKIHAYSYCNEYYNYTSLTIFRMVKFVHENKVLWNNRILGISKLDEIKRLKEHHFIQKPLFKTKN